MQKVFSKQLTKYFIYKSMDAPYNWNVLSLLTYQFIQYWINRQLFPSIQRTFQTKSLSHSQNTLSMQPSYFPIDTQSSHQIRVSKSVTGSQQFTMKTEEVQWPKILTFGLVLTLALALFIWGIQIYVADHSNLEFSDEAPSIYEVNYLKEIASHKVVVIIFLAMAFLASVFLLMIALSKTLCSCRITFPLYSLVLFFNMLMVLVPLFHVLKIWRCVLALEELAQKGQGNWITSQILVWLKKYQIKMSIFLPIICLSLIILIGMTFTVPIHNKNEKQKGQKDKNKSVIRSSNGGDEETIEQFMHPHYSNSQKLAMESVEEVHKKGSESLANASISISSGAILVECGVQCSLPEPKLVQIIGVGVDPSPNDLKQENWGDEGQNEQIQFSGYHRKFKYLLNQSRNRKYDLGEDSNSDREKTDKTFQNQEIEQKLQVPVFSRRTLSETNIENLAPDC